MCLGNFESLIDDTKNELAQEIAELNATFAQMDEELVDHIVEDGKTVRDGEVAER